MHLSKSPLLILLAISGVIALSSCSKPMVPYVPTNLTVKSAKIIGNGEGQLIDLMNKARAKKGLPTLKPDPLITLAAKDHSTAMNTHKFFEHKGLKGEGFATRMLRRGYPISTSGENIAMSEDPARVFQMWVDSPSHNKNMFGKKFSRIGLSRVGKYWTANFAAEPRR